MSRPPRKFLSSAYHLGATYDARTLYEEWSASYDTEIAENGYATPGRCAAALARFAADPSQPVLDYGCGTGLSGLALRMAGFTTIDGLDVSPPMIRQAEARTGVYRQTVLGSLPDPLASVTGAYANAAAVGVISTGHAPPATVDALLAMLPPGGCLVLSLNDHALAVPEFPSKVEEVVASGLADCPFREHGPHLPGIGLESTVYLLRKR